MHALENALAQKQRLWDESVQGGRELGKSEGSGPGATLGRLLGLEVQSERLGQILVLHLPLDAFFEPGSIRLRPAVAAKGAELVKALGGAGQHRIEVRVAGDDLRPISEGPGPFELAAMQAVALAETLLEGGLDPSLLRLTALGASAPRADNDSSEGRTRNRRIELRLEPVGRTGR